MITKLTYIFLALALLAWLVEWIFDTPKIIGIVLCWAFIGFEGIRLLLEGIKRSKKNDI